MAIPSHSQPFQHFIGGDWVASEDGAVFDIFNPLDDSLYGQAAKGSASDMDKAIRAAKAAFPAYRATLPMERERMLLRVAEIMEQRQADLVNCLVDEIGSPVSKAMFEFNKGLTICLLYTSPSPRDS